VIRNRLSKLRAVRNARKHVHRMQSHICKGPIRSIEILVDCWAAQSREEIREPVEFSEPVGGAKVSTFSKGKRER
jgi:hypothetical protein